MSMIKDFRLRFLRFIRVKTWLMLFVAPLVGCLVKLTEGTQPLFRLIPLFITLLLLCSILVSHSTYMRFVWIIYWILNHPWIQWFIVRSLILERDARSTHLNAFSAGFCVVFYPFWLVLMTPFEFAGFCLFYVLGAYYNVRRLVVNQNELALCRVINWNTIVDQMNTNLSCNLLPSTPLHCESDLRLRNTLGSPYLSRIQFGFLLNTKPVRSYTTSAQTVTKSITRTGVEIAKQATETLGEASVPANRTGLVGGAIAGVSLVYAASVASADRKADREAAQQHHEETIAQNDAHEKALQKRHDDTLQFDYQKLEESKRQHDDTMAIQRSRTVSANDQNSGHSDITVEQLKQRVVELEQQLGELKSAHQELILPRSDQNGTHDDDNEPSSESPTDPVGSGPLGTSSKDVTDSVNSFAEMSSMYVWDIFSFFF